MKISFDDEIDMIHVYIPIGIIGLACKNYRIKCWRSPVEKKIASVSRLRRRLFRQHSKAKRTAGVI